MEFNEAKTEVERIAREVGKTATNEHFIYSRALSEFGSLVRKQMNDDRADQLMERLYRHYGFE